MNLVGEKVTHIEFGDGFIVDQTDNKISVKFESKIDVKKFQYPICFKSFLKIMDKSKDAEIAQEIRNIEEAEHQEKERRAQEAAQKALEKMLSIKLTMLGKDDIKPFDTVEEFYEKFKKAIIAEICCQKEDGGKKQKLSDGKFVKISNGRYIYTFTAEEDFNYPDETEINIWIDGKAFEGIILGCEDFTVIIATTKYLGDDVDILEISVESWKLLEALIERLEEMKEKNSDIVKNLVCGGFDAIDDSSRKIVKGQENAVKMAQSQPITFLWGPPGTGKTQTLAEIAIAHIKQGNRVLMLSYSNVAVDGAILRVNKLYENNQPGILVRYGYPREKELLDHEYLSSYNLTIHNYPQLVEERKKLGAELKKTPRTSPKFVEIEAALREIRKSLKEEEIASVHSAMLVATTISKAVVDSEIYGGKFNVVIFDEASMAYVPQIVFSACLATNHFICMGDFRQLPPIVQSNQAKILNYDIFQYCGISYSIERNRNHKWLCLLDIQHRMHPKIADFANYTMYGGMLRSADSMEQQRKAISDAEPIPDCAIGFADLSGTMSVCTKSADNSRVNPLSAFIAFSLALEAAKRHDVGIITPYHAQSRLLFAMARDVSEHNDDLKSISCATVHQFQGSEKDVIIYDAVDCYRRSYPGLLLTSINNNYANRLFNVALTRAKGKFIGVANIDYMDNKKLSPNLMFRRMINMQRKKPTCIKVGDVIQTNDFMSTDIMSFFDAKNGTSEFVSDILSAEKEIRLDIPDSPVDNELLVDISEVLKMAMENGIDVLVRTEDKGHLPVPLKNIAVENPFVANPIAIIDKKKVWFGMPESAANFMSEGMIIKTEYRPVIRFIGSHTATSLYGFMEMSNTLDQSKTIDVNADGTPCADTFENFVLAHAKCPSCGSSMRVQKSKKGKFYLSCTMYPKCQETAFVEPELVNNYFYRHGGTGQHCTKCNCSLEAKLGRYGLYIQCCGIDRHKYKLDEI